MDNPVNDNDMSHKVAPVKKKAKKTAMNAKKALIEKISDSNKAREKYLRN